MLGRDPAHIAALPTRRDERGHDLLPLSTAGWIDQRGAKRGDFSAPACTAAQGA